MVVIFEKEKNWIEKAKKNFFAKEIVKSIGQVTRPNLGYKTQTRATPKPKFLSPSFFFKSETRFFACFLVYKKKYSQFSTYSFFK